MYINFQLDSSMLADYSPTPLTPIILSLGHRWGLLHLHCAWNIIKIIPGEFQLNQNLNMDFQLSMLNC